MTLLVGPCIASVHQPLPLSNWTQEHAFLGLAALLRLNPEAALDAWSALCEALASWRHIRCEGLLNELTQLLHLYKANLVTACPPPCP